MNESYFDEMMKTFLKFVCNDLRFDIVQYKPHMPSHEPHMTALECPETDEPLDHCYKQL